MIKRLLAALLACLLGAFAQTTPINAIVTDFTITNHATGLPLKLSDYEGKIIVIDFFAYWCGPCQVSSPDIETNVQKYYAQRGGNPNGLPVQVIGVSIDQTNKTQTDLFITNAGMDLVGDDTVYTAWSLLKSQDAIPTFCIINGVKNVPGVPQWTLMYRSVGYPGAATLRSVIDPIASLQAPAFATALADMSPSEGGTVTATATASGTAPITYQWFKDGVALTGATSATLSLSNASLADEGFYLCRATNTAGTALSTVAQLRLANNTAQNPFLNFSANTRCTTEGKITPGFVVGGTTGSLTALVRAVGPGLGQFNLTNLLEDPRLTFFNQENTQVLASNDNWGATPGLKSAFATTGAFEIPDASSDAALLIDLPPGSYTAEAERSSCMQGGTVIVEVYRLASTGDAGIVNVSINKHCDAGEVVTQGFVIGGTTPRRVLLRGISEGLKAFGVATAMPDCSLTLFNQKTGEQLALNDNWSTSPEMTATLKAAFAKTGAFVLGENSKDAVVLATLPPGSYTAEVRSSTPSGSGVILVEAYEIR